MYGFANPTTGRDNSTNASTSSSFACGLDRDRRRVHQK